MYIYISVSKGRCAPGTNASLYLQSVEIGYMAGPGPAAAGRQGYRRHRHFTQIFRRSQ